MAQADLKINISGDSAGAEAAIGRTSTAAQSLGGALQSLGGAFAFDKIAGAFGGILKSSSDAQLGAMRFTATLRGAGMAVDPDRFFNFASAMQNVTTIEDDAVISGGTMLARFRLTQDQIEGMLPGLADFSVAMGHDIAGAANSVGRAVMAGGEGLRGLGLGFTDAEKKAFDLADVSGRLGIIQEKMRAQFGGAAQAAAGTASGAMAQLKNAMGELQESFGGVIDSPVGDAIRSLRDIATATKTRFDALSDGSKKLIGGLAGGATIFAAATTGIAAVGGAVSVMGGMASGATTAMRALGAAASGTWLRVAAPAALAIGGVILLIGSLKTAWDGNLLGVRDTMIGVAQNIKGIWDGLVATLKKAWDDFANAVSDKMTYVQTLARTGSPTQASDATAVARQQRAQDSKKPGTTGPSALDTAIDIARAAVITAGEGAANVFGDLKNQFAAGGSVIKDALQSLGLDLSSFDAHTDAAPKPKTASTGGKNADVRQHAAPDTRVDEIQGIMRKVSAGFDDTWLDAAVSAMRGAYTDAGLVESDFKRIAESVGGNVQKAMQIAGDFVRVRSVTAALKSTYEANPPGLPASEQLTRAGATLAEGLVNNLGGVGSTIKNTIQAGMQGGPLAAAAAFTVDLVSRSKSFQAISEKLSAMMDTLAQALNPLFDALGPVLDMAKDLVAAVSDVLGEILRIAGDVLSGIFSALKPFVAAVMPILKAVGDLFRALSPIISALMAVLTPLIQISLPGFSLVMDILKVALDGVTWVLKIVAKALIYTFKGIGWVWNGIIDAIAWVLEGIDTIIPGDYLKDFANTLRKGKMDMDAMDAALRKLDETGTDTAAAQTKQKQELEKTTEELSNLPAMLRVTRMRFEAAMAEGEQAEAISTALGSVSDAGARIFGGASAATGSQKTDLSRQVTIGTLNVNGSTGADTADALKRALEADRYRLTGSTQASPYPYATPRTAGGA